MRSIIRNLSLTATNACTLTLSASVTNLNATALATTSRTQTGTVHTSYGGKTVFTDSTGTTGGSWLNLDSCSSYNDLNIANCPSLMFTSPLNVTLSNLLANQSHTPTATFTIPIVKSFTTGDKIVITAPHGGLVGSASIANTLNNDITQNDTKIVKFSSIANDQKTNTMTLVLNVENNATITTGGQLKFAIDNIANPNTAGTYAYKYKLTNATSQVIQEGTFNPVTLIPIGNSRTTVRVLDRSNNNPVANVKVVFTSPNIGAQTITTDGSGNAIFDLLPDTGMHIDAYINGDSVPSSYLPTWTNTVFDLPASASTPTNTVYLDPANFTTNITLTHSGIGTGGTSKVELYAAGQNGWISKPVTLSATGTTNTLAGAGDYNIGVGKYFDFQSRDRHSLRISADTIGKSRTGLATPSLH